MITRFASTLSYLPRLDRVCYPLNMLNRLSRLAAQDSSGLSPEDRMGLLDDCFQLAYAGLYPPSVPLDFIAAMSGEQEAWVLFTMANLLSTYLSRWSTEDKLEEGVRGLMHRLFASKAETMGFVAKKIDGPLDPLVREACVSTALTGGHERLVSYLVSKT
jgi:hypothetical protein